MIGSLKKSGLILLNVIAVVAFSQPQRIFAEPEPISSEEKIRQGAEPFIVRIDLVGNEGKQGSGVIVDRQGTTYTVLTSWHVVNNSGDYYIQPKGDEKYTVRSNDIQRIGSLDLAELKFTSDQIYQPAKRGNSNDIKKYETLYVAGWINPTQSLRFRTVFVNRGDFVDRTKENSEGYSLVYSLTNPSVGTSGGAVLDKDGLLIGINGQAYRDYNTGAVGTIAAIPINKYAQVKGLSIPPSKSQKISPLPNYTNLPPHRKLSIQMQDIEAELIRLDNQLPALRGLSRNYSDKKEMFKEAILNASNLCDELDKRIESFRQLAFQSEKLLTVDSFRDLYEKIFEFKNGAARFRGELDNLSIRNK